MAGTTLTTTGSSTVGPQSTIQQYFDKKLLEQTLKTIVLDQFAFKAPLPGKAGHKTVRFFRYPESVTTDVATLTEGTAITTGASKQLSLTTVDVTLAQYGQIVTISDLLSAVELFNTMEQATVQNGQDAALKVDELLRNILGDSSALQLRYAGAATSYATVTGTDDAMTALDILDAATNLRVNNARPTGGYFTAIMAPEIARDLMNDDDWLEASKYGNPDNLFKGEVGRYMGVRVVATTNPYRQTSQHTYTAAGTRYSTFVVGDQAYGGVNLATMSAYSPKMVISQGPDKSDPLAQLTTVGFKFYYGGAIINSAHAVNICSVTNYS
jgi:N4-gp56 family major capsid protein